MPMQTVVPRGITSPRRSHPASEGLSKKPYRENPLQAAAVASFCLPVTVRDRKKAHRHYDLVGWHSGPQSIWKRISLGPTTGRSRGTAANESNASDGPFERFQYLVNSDRSAPHSVRASNKNQEGGKRNAETKRFTLVVKREHLQGLAV